MNIILIIAAVFIVTETIDPSVDKGKDVQKKEVVAEAVETKLAGEINSEAQAEAEAQAAAKAKAKAEAEAQAAAKAEAEAQAAAKAQAEAEAEAEAQAQEEAQAQAAAQAAAEAKAVAQAQAEAAEKEINYLKIALYIILLLAVLSGALLYFRKRDKSPLENKIVPPERKEEEQPVEEEILSQTEEGQPIDNANKEPANFEETNDDEKK